MKTKLTKMLLMAAVIFWFSLNVTSCKDDDDDNNGNEEQQMVEQAEKASAFWNVVGQLVGGTQVTDDYKNRTFEPMIGEAKDGNATIRIIATNDISSAAERFANLVGLDDGIVTAETATYTWSDPDVGTLVYTKTTNGSSLATVDVSIRQVPGLQQLVYMTPEQMGTNANFTTCFYRFGDIIKRVRQDDKVNEYWICVRPSFDPEGKGESHWVSLSPLPKQNIEEHRTSGNAVYRLPTKLVTNEEHMLNLAEMLYAITNPKQWEQNVKNNYSEGLFGINGMRMFHDFHKKNLEYHSSLFWDRVATGWSQIKVNVKGTEKDIFELLFDRSKEELKGDLTGENGLHLLHKGYSWWWSMNGDLTLYDFNVKNGDGKKANMHDYNYDKVTTQVLYTNPSEFSRNILVDVISQYTEESPHLDDQKLKANDEDFGFFDDECYHYFIRHATGSELAKIGGGQYNKNESISGFTNVYVYNKRYNIDLSKTPENEDDIKNGSSSN
jgi:hypothetical protein